MTILPKPPGWLPFTTDDVREQVEHHGPLPARDVAKLAFAVDDLRAALAEARASRDKYAVAAMDHLERAVKAEAALGRALTLCDESEQSNDEHDGFPDCYVDVRDLRRALTAELAP